MADVTMCLTEDCPYMSECHRSFAKTSPYADSFEHFEYTCNANSGFDSFIPIINNNT
jgi:hypothetical protein